MRHEIQHGKATLVLLTDCRGDSVPDDEGGPGNGTWRFRREDIRRLRLRDYCEESVTRGGDVIRGKGSLADDLRSNGYDEPGQSEIVVSDADTAIRLLAIMRTKPGTFEVSHDSDGSEMWAWHDLGHAEHDTEIGSRWTAAPDSDKRRAVQIFVDGETESRALVRGAREALRRGVDAAEIVRELAQADKAFAERFEYEADSLAVFLAGCTVTLTPGYGDEPAKVTA